MIFKPVFAAALFSTALMMSNAFAANVIVSNPWARASTAMSEASSAYVTLRNPSPHNHTLVSASSEIATQTELHSHTMKKGAMHNKGAVVHGNDVVHQGEVAGGIVIPSGDTVTLQPRGLHVMLMNLSAPLKENTTFPLTLTFDNGDTTTVDVKVVSMATEHTGKAMKNMAPGHSMDHSH